MKAGGSAWSGLAKTANRSGWDWRPASIVGALLLPALLPVALVALLDHGHLLRAPDGYFWGAALVAGYWMITRLETVDWPAWVNIAGHTLFVVVVAAVLSLELNWQFERRLQAAGEGFQALLALAPLVALYLALDARLPAIARLGDNLRWSLATTLGLLLTLWCVAVNLGNSGASSPLPYLPLLNPLDLTNLALFVLLVKGARRLPARLAEQGRPLRVLIAALVFLWLTALLIRSLHHALDIRFDLDILLGDTRVQTAISILWTIIGIAAMWFAAQRARRQLWIAGALLVGIVLLKMLFVDLGASGTIERIVSFLVVGSLLVGTGYFSPIPPRRETAAATTEDSTHA